MARKSQIYADFSHKIIEDTLSTFLERNVDVDLSIDQILEQINRDQSNPITSQQIIPFMQQFLKQGHVRWIETDDGKSRYIPVSEDCYDKFAGLSQDAHRIYNIIDKSQDKGIWRRDLKTKVNISDLNLSNYIKDLETRLLIKETPSIHDKKRKVLMRYDITPSAEVTGGIWYQDQLFNKEMVEKLIRDTTERVLKKPGIEHYELKREIISTGIGGKVPSDKEAEQVISATLCSDSITKLDNAYYPAFEKPKNPITRLPCCGCPLHNVCTPEGEINPVDCPYMAQMTELF